jgi:UrcA family protein
MAAHLYCPKGASPQHEEDLQMRIGTKTILTAAAAALAMVSAAAPAQAQDNNREYRSVTVSYADLNLNSEEGAKRLQYRITSAARKVCGPRPSRNLKYMMDYQQCFKVAANGGKKAMVTLLAQAKDGKALAGNGTLSISG